MLEIITPAESTRLTTLDAVKVDLGITGSASDDALGKLIDQCSATIATWCGRTFGRETVRETRDVRARDDRHELLLGRWPVAQIVSISVAGIELAPSAYALDPAKGELRYRGLDGRLWLWPAGNTVATYTTGYLLPGDDGRTLPHEIERACILMVRGAWHSSGRDPLLRSEDTDGVASFTYFASAGSAISLEVQSLLSAYQTILVV